MSLIVNKHLGTFDAKVECDMPNASAVHVVVYGEDEAILGTLLVAVDEWEVVSASGGFAGMKLKVTLELP